MEDHKISIVSSFWLLWWRWWRILYLRIQCSVNQFIMQSARSDYEIKPWEYNPPTHPDRFITFILYNPYPTTSKCMNWWNERKEEKSKSQRCLRGRDSTEFESGKEQHCYTSITKSCQTQRTSLETSTYSSVPLGSELSIFAMIGKDHIWHRISTFVSIHHAFSIDTSTTYIFTQSINSNICFLDYKQQTAHKKTLIYCGRWYTLYTV